MSFTLLELKVSSAIKNNQEFSLLEGVCAASGYTPEELFLCNKYVQFYTENILRQHPGFHRYAEWEKVSTIVCQVEKGVLEYDDNYRILEAFRHKKGPNCVAISSMIGSIAEKLGCKVEVVESPFHCYIKINGINVDGVNEKGIMGSTRKQSRVMPKKVLLSMIYTWRAWETISKGDSIMAEKFLRKSVKVSPDMVLPHIILNQISNHVPIDKLRKYLELKRKFGEKCEIDISLAMYLKELGNKGGAEHYSLKAINAADDSKYVRNCFIDIQKWLGRR
ncbi:MAG: hypothetical protein ABIB71_06835 [Candidatus Woesearchaeota archaeon]